MPVKVSVALVPGQIVEVPAMVAVGTVITLTVAVPDTLFVHEGVAEDDTLTSWNACAPGVAVETGSWTLLPVVVVIVCWAPPLTV